MTGARCSGCRARRPRAIRLWVLPPPIAWVSRNTPWADLPSRRRNPSVRRVRMPSVTWFSAKNSAGSMRSRPRSVRSSTVSRRVWSNTPARGTSLSLPDGSSLEILVTRFRVVLCGVQAVDAVYRVHDASIPPMIRPVRPGLTSVCRIHAAARPGSVAPASFGSRSARQCLEVHDDVGMKLRLGTAYPFQI